MPKTKQHGGKDNREVDEIQTTSVRNERATSMSQDIRGFSRSQSGSIKALIVDLKKIFDNKKLLDKVFAMMQKTVLMDSESMVRRVMSGII